MRNETYAITDSPIRIPVQIFESFESACNAFKTWIGDKSPYLWRIADGVWSPVVDHEIDSVESIVNISPEAKKMIDDWYRSPEEWGLEADSDIILNLLQQNPKFQVTVKKINGNGGEFTGRLNGYDQVIAFDAKPTGDPVLDLVDLHILDIPYRVRGLVNDVERNSPVFPSEFERSQHPNLEVKFGDSCERDLLGDHTHGFGYIKYAGELTGTCTAKRELTGAITAFDGDRSHPEFADMDWDAHDLAVTALEITVTLGYRRIKELEALKLLFDRADEDA